jgi:DNA-binding beta-propeller fold protein YncE
MKTLVFAVLNGFLFACFAEADIPLRLEKEIPLNGVDGRIDHFSVDTAGHTLFVAALGAGSVQVIDTELGQRSGEIKGLQEPQGVCYDAKKGRLYVATAGDGKLRIYDSKSLSLQNTLSLGSDADNVRYDQQTGDIWVGFGSGGIAVINSEGQPTETISLGTHPESFLFEDPGDRVFVNVPKQFGVAVVDRKKRSVIAKWGVGRTVANYPMALDAGRKRLFVGCRLPARLVVLDTVSGAVKASLPTVGDSDDIFYDASRSLVYVIGGEGAIEIFRQTDPDHSASVAKIPTASGARTGFFVPEWNKLFVAAPHRGSNQARILVFAGR